MDVSALLQERIKLYRDAVQFKKIERIPHTSLFQNWRILDSGYPLSQAMSDYDIMEKVVCEHQEKYNFDLMVDKGVRNPYLLYKILGSERYIINDEEGTVNYKDCNFCEHGELTQFASDYWKFIWEKGMSRKFGFWNGDFDIDIIQKALEIRDKHNAFGAKMNTLLSEKYGMPNFCAPIPPAPVAVETIYSYPRGIKGLAIDMRKEPEKLDELVEMYNEMSFYPTMKLLKSMPAGPNPNTAFDMGTTFLCQNILNEKQWEKYYWPYLKPVLDNLVDKSWTYSIFIEGAVLRFKDYFKDYPKGHLSFMLENDDVFEFRKELPNCAIMGGLSNNLLGIGTKEECIALAKRLIDELGAQGGYTMTQTKIGAFKNDAKAENLKAVCDFVLDYRPSQN